MQEEKIEQLKNTIQKLYTCEGRSLTYISHLLEINRNGLRNKILEWGLTANKSRTHLKPSLQKFLNKNKSFIVKQLENGVTVKDIAIQLNTSRAIVDYIIDCDAVLTNIKRTALLRKDSVIKDKKEKLKEQSSLVYIYEDLEDEEWQPILGYPGYMVSNMGRIKKYVKQYDSYYLIKPCPNKNNGRLYVGLTNEKQRQNLQVARLVGFAFVPGHSEEKNTINHKDGLVSNNKWTNLEWVSQSENNKHAYRKLNRSIVDKKRYNFSTIVYQNKYEFKTVAALAKFLGKSETQTRRYLDNPDKYNIKLIK